MKIKEYEDYEITRDGRVYNTKRNKEIIPRPNPKGYLKIRLNKDGKRYSFFIHRLVAQHYIPNPENKPTVNHIDHNVSNNNVENLEWSTHKEQAQHSNERKGNLNDMIKLWRLDMNGNKIELMNTIDALNFVKTNKLSEGLDKTIRNNIITSARGLADSAYGYKWKYPEEEQIKGEKWKELEEKEGYFISNMGRMKNTKTGRILTGHINGNDMLVYISGVGKKNFARLVAKYYIPNPNNYLYVKRRDGIKSNVRADNLYWSRTCN